MIGGADEAFVVKAGEFYCRFGSYGNVTFVASPLKATLYSRRYDAEARTERGYYAAGVEIPRDRLAVVKIKADVWEVADG